MADEKKLIIDEDWKSQVEAEKEQAQKAKDSAPASAPSGAEQEMPPASFELLLTMLATEALMALGQVPNPVTGEAQVQRAQAKYLIDMIEVLQEKTKGNLTPAEQELIETLLHQMRLVFVETANQAAPSSSPAESPPTSS